MKKFARIAATAAAVAGLGLVGLGAATDAQAKPGPFPQWCPGEFWDPGWGDNWDRGGCHDNFRGRGGPGWDRDHRGFDNRGGFDNHGGPNRGGPGRGPEGGPHGGPEGHR
jgi:hypothetical protein